MCSSSFNLMPLDLKSKTSLSLNRRSALLTSRTRIIVAETKIRWDLMVVFVKVKAKTNPSAPTLRQWRWMMETVNSAIEFAIVDGGGVVWPLQRRKHINSSRVTQMERCTERSCYRILLQHDAHTSLRDAVPFPLCISPLHCTTRPLTYWSWSRKRGRM